MNIKAYKCVLAVLILAFLSLRMLFQAQYSNCVLIGVTTVELRAWAARTIVLCISRVKEDHKYF